MKDKTRQWKRVLIKDFCESIIDCVNKTAHTVEGPTPYKMIRTTNVKAGSIDLINVRYVTKEIYDRWTRRAVPRKGDVILTREAPLGEVGMLRINDTIFLGQRLIQYRVDPKKLDNLFLLYSFQDHDLQAQIKSFGSGATVEHMRVPDAEKLTILLPDLLVQKKIASILSSYDNLIENNTRRIEILEQMAKLIYEEWFVKFKFPGHENIKMMPSELGEIPEGWEVRSIREITTLIKRGVTPKYDESSDSIVINQKCIRNFRLDLEESRKHISKVPHEKNVVKGDILINSTGIGTLGRVAQVLEDFPNYTVDTHLTIVRPNENISFSFFGLQLFRLQSYFESQGRGATGQTELGRDTIEEIKIIVAPKEIQDSFSNLVNPLRNLAIKLDKKNQNLRKTRDLLLPKLISGEIDVSDLDIHIRNEFQEL